jgi:hypothetical protein
MFDRVLILSVSLGGSLGLGPMEQLIRALQQLKTPVQIVAVCGRNEPLKAGIDQIVSDRPAGPAPPSISSTSSQRFAPTHSRPRRDLQRPCPSRSEKGGQHK